MSISATRCHRNGLSREEWRADNAHCRTTSDSSTRCKCSITCRRSKRPLDQPLHRLSATEKRDPVTFFLRSNYRHVEERTCCQTDWQTDRRAVCSPRATDEPHYPIIQTDLLDDKCSCTPRWMRNYLRSGLKTHASDDLFKIPTRFARASLTFILKTQRSHSLCLHQKQQHVFDVCDKTRKRATELIGRQQHSPREVKEEKQVTSRPAPFVQLTRCQQPNPIRKT